MADIIKYTTIEAWSYDFDVAQCDLHHAINNMLDKGWEPLGGVAVAWVRPAGDGRGYFVLIQAMIKRTKEETTT
jgi:hypothetical protein